MGCMESAYYLTIRKLSSWEKHYAISSLLRKAQAESNTYFRICKANWRMWIPAVGKHSSSGTRIFLLYMENSGVPSRKYSSTRIMCPYGDGYRFFFLYQFRRLYSSSQNTSMAWATFEASEGALSAVALRGFIYSRTITVVRSHVPQQFLIQEYWSKPSGYSYWQRKWILYVWEKSESRVGVGTDDATWWTWRIK